MFIIENTVAEDKRNALVEKFSKMAGVGVKVDKLGLKKFAQEINHKKDGYYYLMNFNAEHTVPKKIGELMNITDGIIRYIFVNKDEFNHKQSKKRKVEAKGE
jgi:small subunit ribosomal protein S6